MPQILWRLLLAWTVACLLGLSDDEDEDKPPVPLLPGLVVVCRSPGHPVVEVLSTQPNLALALKPGEAPHPALDPDRFTIRWTGRLRILRPAEYELAVGVQGDFTLRLDGREVLSTSKPRTALRLEPGNHKLEAEFIRRPGPAVLRVYWKTKTLFPEPIPYDVLGHLPEDEPADLERDRLVETGRMLAEEFACTACHRPSDGDAVGHSLKNRLGPDLSRVGERASGKWIASWIRYPQALQSHAVMPSLIPDGPHAEAEVFAIASYLASLGRPVRERPERMPPNEQRASQARGEKLFNSIGCAVCHGPETRVYPLGKYLAEKTSVQALTRFLLDPLATHPAGRMPNMLLTPQEAQDLARFLLKDRDALPDLTRPERQEADALFDSLTPDAAPRKAFREMSDEAAWKQLGERLLTARRCTACHAVEVQGRKLPSMPSGRDFSAIAKPEAVEKGCLADRHAPDSGSPQFGFTLEQRRALRAFLRHGATGRSTPAPMHAAEKTLRQLNCLACHQRHGSGGLSSAMIELLRFYESAENAEAITPPPLTETGAKLTSRWLRAVLLEGGRARPWMSLRMPQFGADNVGHLPHGLAGCDGIADDVDLSSALAGFEPTASPIQDADIEAGRVLVGKKAFGCIGCHDIAGVPSSGTRGPDLALMNQRVRYPWYRRWMVQPQRMQPGTRMPTVFNEGRSLVDEVLSGDANRQADAIWHYLALGPTLPLPDGLEPPKGMVVTVKDRPVLMRTFLPEIGSRGIAVGFPEQVSVAYDAAQARLAYAWTGNFLDAAPVWYDRGGNPAKILGTRFWQAPPGFPWFITAEATPPRIEERLKDPAFGAPVPEGQVFTGQRRLHFGGFRIESRDGSPSFAANVTTDDGQIVRIEEHVQAVRSNYGVGLRRSFRLNGPNGRHAWLLLESAQAIRFLTEGGQRIPTPQPVADPEAPADGGRIGNAGAIQVVVPDGRGVVTVLESVPPGSAWAELRLGPHKAMAVRFPLTGEASVVVSHWQPYRPTDKAP
ncbi:MAG: c-type cytochrome [Gemmatales bacterium]|nr:c-type cytochrome [Gemmatales bacterium]MDW8386514.1 c-type cytochrome [Gemmatales bacterium]